MAKASERMGNRAKRAFSERANQRAAIRKLLRKGLKDATQIQCYDRTSKPTSGRLLKSVFTKSDSRGIEVGYKGSIAPHARRRLAQTGRSKEDGHDLEMRPAEFIEQVVGDKIMAIARGTLKRILG